MKLAGPALILVVLAALVAGCGGGGSTTVVEKTVTVESGGGGESSGGGETGGGEEATVGSEKAGDETATGGDTGGQVEAEVEKQTEKTEAPPETIEAPTAVVHLQTFRSPSGNIGCVMFEGGARCDIRDREWSPPARPASCPEQVDFGQGLGVSHTGKASFVCAGDTALDPTGTPLAYGEVSEVGGTQCMSRTDGVTCSNHSGHGFFISVQSYKLF